MPETMWKKVISRSFDKHWRDAYVIWAKCDKCNRWARMSPDRVSHCNGCGRMFKIEYTIYYADLATASDGAPEHPTVRLDERART